MPRNDPDDEPHRAVALDDNRGSRARVPTKVSVTWTLHAVLHGQISSGSDELGSLIMMEVRASSEGIRDVEFEMQFKALEPGEPDPEVLDTMPSEKWQFDQETTDLDGPATALGDPTTYRIIGSKICKGNDWGRPDTATWRTNGGDALLRLLRPAVLLRRQSNRPFQALCQVRGKIIHPGKIRELSGYRGIRPDPVLFDPVIGRSLDDRPVTLENLQEFMKDIKRAGQNSAAVLMKMDEESRLCLLSLSEWILKEAQSKNWLSSDDHSRVLWIHGRPGLGKTILATFLLQELQMLPSISGEEKKGVVAYYVFAPRANRGNGVIMVLRSLIHQVILQKPHLIKYLLETYREPGVGEKVFSDHILLWEILGRITLDPQVEVAYFVINGLEQCDEELLRIFKDLKSSPSSMLRKSSSTSPRSKDKWILVSRDDPAIEMALSGFSDIDLNANPASYMEESVRVGIDQLGLSDNAFRNSLREVLMDRANGSVIWLKFALVSVWKDPKIDMETLQKRLPRGLPLIIDQTLDSLLQVPDDTAREINDLRDKILNACGPLVQIHDDAINLTHHSVNDYLKSSTANAKLNYGSLHDLHKKVSVCCLQYICQAFAESESTDILEYPAMYWMEHGRQSSQTSEDLGVLFDSNSFLAENSETLKRWLSMYWRHRYGVGEIQPTNFTMMHIAAESGYVQFVRVLLKRGYAIDVNALDGSEKTPLHWAALYGHYDVARVLLEAGANVHIRAGDHSSVLQIAIQSGQKAMAQLL
ncbi:hypothetical protein BDW59DRAFT_164182 [Aspergillus cavernicola]|uniref:Nephrocystin 3-like N-terminal domain-containing protein n=1 Tax=Aspergillus cavernicola TaxID=176166 RepID=A0ABR4I134_9EURO